REAQHGHADHRRQVDEEEREGSGRQVEPAPVATRFGHAGKPSPRASAAGHDTHTSHHGGGARRSLTTLASPRCPAAGPAESVVAWCRGHRRRRSVTRLLLALRPALSVWAIAGAACAAPHPIPPVATGVIPATFAVYLHRAHRPGDRGMVSVVVQSRR